MLEFPNSPTDGQQITQSNGVTYIWVDAKSRWEAQPEQLWVRKGTFAPELWDSSNSGAEGQTYVFNVGRYRRIDDLVWINVDMQMSSLGSLTPGQTAHIGNLPFLIADTWNPAIAVSLAANLAVTVDNLSGYFENFSAGNRIWLQKWGAATGSQNLTIAEFGTSGRVAFSGWYTTDDP